MMADRIKELPEGERPYEKVLKSGAEVLSDAELLAVILRTGSKHGNSVDLARSILKLHPAHQNLTALYHLTLSQLTGLQGMGEVKAIQVLCIAELSRRLSRCSSEPQLSFTNPESIADYYMEHLCHLGREEIHVMFFDSRHRMICEMKLAEGTVQEASSTPREILIEGIKCEAVFMILVHNHPSGVPEPSEADFHFTRRVGQAGKLVGILLSDHIIIGNHCYVSLKERGYIS